MSEGRRDGPHRSEGREADRGHLTPEQAARATWQEAPAAADVVSVTARGDRAEVVVRTDPESHDWVYCVRDGAGWRPVVSGDGPTPGWDDPDRSPDWS